jgi:hypothetical protein
MNSYKAILQNLLIINILKFYHTNNITIFILINTFKFSKLNKLKLKFKQNLEHFLY